VGEIWDLDFGIRIRDLPITDIGRRGWPDCSSLLAVDFTDFRQLASVVPIVFMKDTHFVCTNARGVLYLLSL